MYYKEIKVIGSRGMAPKDFLMAIKMVECGKDGCAYLNHPPL